MPWHDDGKTEWFKAGYIRNRKTRRWHPVVRLDGETIVSERSFKTKEEVLEGLKEWAAQMGGMYRPIQ